MDFEDSRRQDVIDYVVNKYGRERVAQIVTFGTMAARAAIKDCGRAMNKMPMAEVEKLAKMIPTLPVGIKLTAAMEANPELKAAYQGSAQARELIDTALRLEGLTRHDSVHAAGVVIAADPLWENVPLQKADDGLGLVTQYPAGYLGENRPAQDGLSGPGEPHHPGPRRPQRQADPRRGHQRPQTALWTTKRRMIF